jgi:hypothetical protein
MIGMIDMSHNIIIPEYISMQGGEVLNEFVKVAIEIREYEAELVKIDNKLEEAFTNVYKQIGKYLPTATEERVMMGHHSIPHTSYEQRRIIPNININETWILGEIYSSEEYLKKIRGLILDRKHYWKQKEELTRKLNKIGVK